ncbi:hypothetical protein NDU88_003025 [Pleurodeles waltl]|uniref:Uncharacterized protein n=1 Tax=Pleurodeles waltl TaxID=8319 RepID=A0AAV7MZ09_PLEWA|nr:hypothetical protein NDU88_003025 [Pleurodeles waltl]
MPAGHGSPCRAPCERACLEGERVSGAQSRPRAVPPARLGLHPRACTAMLLRRLCPINNECYLLAREMELY